MLINQKQIGPGVWPVENNLLSYFQEALTEPKENQILFCKGIGSLLDLDYVDHVIYDYKYVIEKGSITAGPSLWHSDGNGKFDCQLMTYIVNPKLTAQTGMRVGFRNNLTNQQNYVDLKTGSCFLARQDSPEYQHHVEPMLESVIQRICFTICFRGLNRLGII